MPCKSLILKGATGATGPVAPNQAKLPCKSLILKGATGATGATGQAFSIPIILENKKTNRDSRSWSLRFYAVAPVAPVAPLIIQGVTCVFGATRPVAPVAPNVFNGLRAP